MATVVKTGNSTFTLTLFNLKKREKALTSFIDNGGVFEVINKVCKQAHKAMEDSFMSTRKADKDKRKVKGRLTMELFSARRLPVMIGKNKARYEIVQSDLFEEYPYLGAQESGARKTQVMQAYKALNGSILPYGKNAVTKEEAAYLNETVRKRDAKGRFVKGTKNKHSEIEFRPVTHFVRPRHFIRAAIIFLQSRGKELMNKYLEEELKKRGLQ